jgi:hypothetical protein
MIVMFRVSVAVAIVCAGCSFKPNAAGTGDGGADDASDGIGVLPDAPLDGDPNLPCYGIGIVRVCPQVPPPAAYDIGADTRVDTDIAATCSHTVTGMNIVGTCVIVAQKIQITRALQVVGSKPLVLVATDTLVVMGSNGRIDVASHRGGNLGAGANSALCPNNGSPGGGGGGPGGSFTGRGGAGGNGGATSGVGMTIPAVLRGGCPGTKGAGNAGGNGGAGGGGVYLIAGTSIAISSTINASGMGGEGAGASLGAGGGGGGSGGMIVLDAPTVNISGSVFANGGGGGEGADVAGGHDGADPTSASSAARGGNGGNIGGGGGGDGSVGTTLDGDPGGDSVFGTQGGGAGGGGAGFIRIYGIPNISGTVSPPQT